MDGSAADVAKNPGRHAPQRTSATGEIAVSLPINLVALVKAHRPQCRVLESGAPNSAETVFETITPTKDHTVGAMFRPQCSTCYRLRNSGINFRSLHSLQRLSALVA